MSANQKKKKEEEKRRREKWKKRAKLANQAIPDREHQVPSAVPERRLNAPPNTRIISTPSGMRKMSELIEELVDPYIDSCEDEIHSLRNLILLGVTAWNAEVIGPEAGLPLIESFINSARPEAQPLMAALLATLIDRKSELFPDDLRFIADFAVHDRPTGPYIEILSILDEFP